MAIDELRLKDIRVDKTNLNFRVTFRFGNLDVAISVRKDADITHLVRSLQDAIRELRKHG